MHMGKVLKGNEVLWFCFGGEFWLLLEMCWLHSCQAWSVSQYLCGVWAWPQAFILSLVKVLVPFCPQTVCVRFPEDAGAAPPIPPGKDGVSDRQKRSLAEKKHQMSAVAQVCAAGCHQQSPGTFFQGSHPQGHTSGILSLIQPWGAARGVQWLHPISAFWLLPPQHSFNEKEDSQISFHSNN